MYRVPVSARANLIGRLRDRNDINHRAAKYELLLYAFWRNRGYRVNLNEPVGVGDADLLVSNGANFLIEVATVFPDPAEERRYRHLHDICAAIDGLRDDEFVAEVDANYGWPPVNLTPRAAKRDVRDYLERVKRDEASPQSGVQARKGDREITPRLPVWRLCWSNQLPTVEWRSTPEQARSAVEKKVQKFKSIKHSGQPLVVALCDGGLHQNFHQAIDRVLFGSPGVMTMRNDDRVISRGVRSSEGFFGPTGASTRLSAVLGCSYQMTTRSIELRMRALA